jgi:hypothetical protein
MPASVPYQWVIRRLFLGRFLDSDAVNFPVSATGLKLVELSPNVQFATGGSHNSLIISRKDNLVIIDAPINEWQSRWTIDAAKARYPGKTIVSRAHASPQRPHGRRADLRGRGSVHRRRRTKQEALRNGVSASA